MTESHMLEIRKTARILDQATGNYLERIEFRTSSGKMAILELAPSTVSDPRSFAKHLRDAGAILPTDRTLLKPLLEAVAGTISVCRAGRLDEKWQSICKVRQSYWPTFSKYRGIPTTKNERPPDRNQAPRKCWELEICGCCTSAIVIDSYVQYLSSVCGAYLEGTGNEHVRLLHVW